MVFLKNDHVLIFLIQDFLISPQCEGTYKLNVGCFVSATEVCTIFDFIKESTNEICQDHYGVK